MVPVGTRPFLSHSVTSVMFFTDAVVLSLGSAILSHSLHLVTFLLYRPRKGTVDGSEVDASLVAGLGFTLPGDFGAGYSSIRIRLLPFAARVAKLSTALPWPNVFTSGLISGLTSGGTSASIPGVFFMRMITGVSREVLHFPLLLPCTRLLLGLSSASVVI